MEMTKATLYSGLVLILTFVFFSIRLVRTKRNKCPPSGPLALPIIGHLHLLNQPLHQTLARISSRHGPLLLLRFGYRPVLLVTSPSVVEECFTKNDITFANRPFLLAGKYFGRDHSDLVSAPYSPHWRNQRKVTTLHIFSSSRITALSSVRAEEVRSLVRQLFVQSINHHGYNKVEMKTKLKDLTYNMTMEIIAGKRSVPEEGRRFQGMIEEAFCLSAASNVEDFLPLMGLMGKGVKKRMAALMGEMDDLLQDMIEKRRLWRSPPPQNGEDKTIIDVMLSLQEKDALYYTDEVIKGIIHVIILGGTETSSGTMEWALSLLLNNPEVLKKARHEINVQVGCEKLVTDSELSSLPYLNNVIKETLRLFPPGPLLLPHHSSKECNIGGYNIPSGTMLLVNAYAIHRDPNIWEDPLKFKPERFEGGEWEGYMFIPFGSGRRRCPGDVLAMRLMALALGTLIQCFEWERIGEEEVNLTEGKGLTMPKAIPLEAMYKPRQDMIHILSQL